MAASAAGSGGERRPNAPGTADAPGVADAPRPQRTVTGTKTGSPVAPLAASKASKVGSGKESHRRETENALVETWNGENERP